MLRKFLIYTIILLETLFANEEILSQLQKVESLHKMYLKLPDQREVIISYHPEHGEDGVYKIRIFLRQGSKILWDKTFSEDYSEYWTRASFMPVISRQYFSDLDDDGYYEIAISVSHGGMAVWNTPTMIFTVKEKSLEFLRKQQTNEEFSEFVYSSKDDFKNPNYKCGACKEKEYYYADGKKAPLGDPRHKVLMHEKDRLIQNVPNYLLRK
jgi:hypothetical protein